MLFPTHIYNSKLPPAKLTMRQYQPKSSPPKVFFKDSKGTKPQLLYRTYSRPSHKPNPSKQLIFPLYHRLAIKTTLTI
ncbi:hypothetical protein WN944_014625 [Citrus x changshan-huyou]|uniref:Uncharacterized protein n=1 Tax=Citrus x changshan-huyou TaxID=2935761 RepID=A0AAP0M634_9ROSI